MRLGSEFIATAEQMFPPGGSPNGDPSFEVFSENVLAAASLAFGRDFERWDTGNGIGAFTTAETQFFRKPLVFFARLIADRLEVELIDLDVDEDWIDWDVIFGVDDDPR